MNIDTQTHSEEIMSEINMTPFVDVMLVLLIVFIVTLPLIHHSIGIELPKISSQPHIEPLTALNLKIDQYEQYWMDQQPINREQLLERLTAVGRHPSKPVVTLYADKSIKYECIMTLLAHIHQAGLNKIAFVTQEHLP